MSCPSAASLPQHKEGRRHSTLPGDMAQHSRWAMLWFIVLWWGWVEYGMAQPAAAFTPGTPPRVPATPGSTSHPLLPPSPGSLSSPGNLSSHERPQLARVTTLGDQGTSLSKRMMLLF